MSYDYRAKRYDTSNFLCPICKNYFPIPRPYRQRQKDHKKKIYCPWCKKKTYMVEIRQCDKERMSL